MSIRPLVVALFELPEDTAAFYTPLDPYNADQVFGKYGQDFAFGNKKSGKKGQRAPAKPLVPATGAASSRATSGDNTTHPVHLTSAVSSGADGTLSSGLSLSVLSLSDEQIDRIARNRANALKIRNEKRLLWLHTRAELSHVPSSPDSHIDPIVRTIQNVRSGATLRRRFAYGKVRPADALACTAADMRPASKQHPDTGQGASDGGLPFGSWEG